MAFIGNTPISVAFLTDTFSGNGSTTAFTMTVAPANTSSIIVAITGVLQDPSTYSVSGTTLTFSAAPPSGTSNISVRYLGIPASGVTTTAYRTVTNFTATAGQTSFSVPSYTVGYIDVYRNGVRLVSTDFTATTGTTVVLANACTSGDAVVTESFYVSSVLNAIPATAGAVNSTYIADNAITTAAIADNAITTAKIAAGAVIQADLATGVAGTGPAFFAGGATTTCASGVTTLITNGTETFDTGGCYNNTGSTVTLNGISAPAYSFAPNVAGYYQFTAVVFINGSSADRPSIHIYKNGSNIIQTLMVGTAILGGQSYQITGLISLNGTSDYVQCYYTQASGSSLPTNSSLTYFCGSLMRAA